jgi:hypothetical protein
MTFQKPYYIFWEMKMCKPNKIPVVIILTLTTLFLATFMTKYKMIEQGKAMFLVQIYLRFILWKLRLIKSHVLQRSKLHCVLRLLK